MAGSHETSRRGHSRVQPLREPEPNGRMPEGHLQARSQSLTQHNTIGRQRADGDRRLRANVTSAMGAGRYVEWGRALRGMGAGRYVEWGQVASVFFCFCC